MVWSLWGCHSMTAQYKYNFMGTARVAIAVREPCDHCQNLRSPQIVLGTNDYLKSCVAETMRCHLHVRQDYGLRLFFQSHNTSPNKIIEATAHMYPC